MSGPRVRLDRADGQTLVGVDGETVAATAAVSDDPDPEEVREALRDLYQELRHSAGLDDCRPPEGVER